MRVHDVQRHLHRIKLESVLRGGFKHSKMHVRILVSGEANVAGSSRPPRFEQCLCSTLFIEETIRIFEANHFVKLQEIDVIDLEPTQRFIDLFGRRFSSPSVKFRHQEHTIAIAIGQCFAHANLTVAIIVIPAVVHERQPAIDRRPHDPNAFLFVLNLADMRTAQAEDGNPFAGFSEQTCGKSGSVRDCGCFRQCVLRQFSSHAGSSNHELETGIRVMPAIRSAHPFYKPSARAATGLKAVSAARIYSLQLAGFRIFAPMKSMTGYGRGECSQDGFKVTVELSSVNRKQTEISVTMPRELELLEAQIRDVINRHVARGRLTVRVTLHAAAGNVSARMHLNTELAKAYARELTKLSKQLKLTGPVTLDHLVRAPGVFQTDQQLAEEEDFWPAVEKALKKALDGLLKMREREGQHLEQDLAERISIMRKAASQIRKQAPKVAERYREQLMERIRNAGLESPAPDDERLLKEVVYFADRSDITEELTRLQSHFKQFDDCLNSKEPIGRTLDFLAQEMNREVNTIGSKANDSLISREVVTLKAELEKFREQAQNVE